MDDQIIIATLSEEMGRTKQEISNTLGAYFKALKGYLNSGIPVTIEGFGKISHQKVPGRVDGKDRKKRAYSSRTRTLLDPDASIRYASLKGGDDTSGSSDQDYHIDFMDDIYLLDTKKILSELIVDMGIEQKLLAEKVFEITPNTLRSYRQEKNKDLSPRLKEIALRIQVLYSKGKELFLTTESFNSWLNKDQIGLEDRKPIELINTITGINMVIEELLRIEYGATA